MSLDENRDTYYMNATNSRQLRVWWHDSNLNTVEPHEMNGLTVGLYGAQFPVFVIRDEEGNIHEVWKDEILKTKWES